MKTNISTRIDDTTQIPDDIKTLCELVLQATNVNDHTGARRLIAKHFNLHGYVTKFDCIRTIHDIDGSLQTDVRSLRDRYTWEILNWIHKNHDGVIYRAITRSL
jgi:hypothetical protein